MSVYSRGWVDQPDGRGTFDILQTCLGTIALLCWSSVCPNVPSLKSGRWTALSGKIQLFFLAILGPDFVFMIALGQLDAAWRLKKKFKALKLSNPSFASWGLRQCFFINMGGVHVRFADRKEDTTFPVQGDQLLFLLKEGFITSLELDEKDIEERNKTDELSRAIAVVQCLWFTINSFGRVAQGLHLTTLEITTLAFILLMSACVVFWWRKPMDIRYPLILESESKLLDAVARAAEMMPEASTKHGATPLSFLSRHEWYLSQHWMSYVQILRNLKILPPRRAPLTADHVPSIEFPETRTTSELVAGPLVVMYSAVFMAAWNNQFPSITERTLWRIASMTSLLYGIIGCALATTWHDGTSLSGLIGDRIKALLRPKATKSSTEDHQELSTGQTEEALPTHNIQGLDARHSHDSPTQPHIFRSAVSWVKKIGRSLSRTRSISPHNDPALAVSIHVWAFTSFLCGLYCISRLYILVEDFAGLRDPPASTFKTVDWGQYSPIL